jgi:hypothetical protein
MSGIFVICDISCPYHAQSWSNGFQLELHTPDRNYTFSGKNLSALKRTMKTSAIPWGGEQVIDSLITEAFANPQSAR